MMKEQTNFVPPKQDLIADWISLAMVILAFMFVAWIIGNQVLANTVTDNFWPWLSTLIITMIFFLGVISTLIARVSIKLDAEGIHQISLAGRKYIRWNNVIQIHRVRARVWMISISDGKQSIEVAMTQFSSPRLAASLIRDMTPQLSHENLGIED